MADEWLAWAKRVKVYPFFEARAPKTPQVANRPLDIRCRVTARSKSGVILAQGGRTHGYALHLEDGHLCFSVRVNGDVREVRGLEVPDGELDVRAVLDRQAKMKLFLNGELVGEGQAASLIPVEPQDELSIGLDTQTAVGNYQSPHPLDGDVEDVVIETE
ncbi:MAG: hypothetical protein RL885_20600 [Planctomycetota bacterium]